MNSNARQPNESFKKYVLRRKANHEAMKRARKGRLVWLSSNLFGLPLKVWGTYIRAVHGEMMEERARLLQDRAIPWEE